MKRGGLQIAICWLDHCAPDEKGRESGIHGRDSMARIYRVRTRDTLRKIAERFYRETECLERLALYNGILDPDRIWVGQSIEIPSKRELLGASLPRRGGLVRPHGLAEILSTFGNIYDFILDDGTLDPRWESEYLARTQLPFPIPLWWEPSTVVRSLYCHSRLGELFAEVFSVLDVEGLRGAIRTYGGCFNFRSKRSHGKLSTHSWGISIGKCANLSWELKRLQTPWFDGVGQNKIKPRRKEPRWEVCYVRSRNARSRVVWVRSRW